MQVTTNKVGKKKKKEKKHETGLQPDFSKMVSLILIYLLSLISFS